MKPRGFPKDGLKVLEILYHSRPEWVAARTLPTRGGDYAKLRHWGLTEKREGRAGQWRITPAGRAFFEGKTTVANYLLMYHKDPLGFLGPEIRVVAHQGSHYLMEDVVE